MRSRQTAVTAGVIVVVLVLLGVFVVRPFFFSSSGGYTDATTLSVLSGDVRVQPAGQTEFAAAREAMQLGAEDRVRTGLGSYALITFFEGSTAELEPGTEVLITSLLRGRSSRASANAVAFRQVSGTTWNHILAAADPSSVHEISTPTAVIEGHDASLKIRVQEATGDTEIQAFKGAASVRAQGVRAQLAPYTQTTVAKNSAPAVVTPVAPLSGRLVVTADAPVWARIVDEHGRSAGFVAPGLQVNQIPGSQVGGPFANPTTIEIPASASGQFRVVLEGAREGTYQFVVQGVFKDAPVFIQGVQGAIKPGHQFLGVLTVIAQGDKLVSGQLGNFLALTTAQEAPGRFVRTQLAVAGVQATATAYAMKGTPVPGFPTPLTLQTPTRTAVAGTPGTSLTGTATVTATPATTPAETPRATPTAPARATDTPAPRATNTPVAPTATSTSAAPRATNTPVAPTATIAPTVGASPTPPVTPTSAATPRPTSTPQATMPPPASTATRVPPATPPTAFTPGPAP